MILHKLSVHPDSAARFPPLRRGGQGGWSPRTRNLVCGSRVAETPRNFRLGRDRWLCPVTPLPPLRKRGKGIARSHRHSIERNKNAGLETVP